MKKVKCLFIWFRNSGEVVEERASLKPSNNLLSYKGGSYLVEESILRDITKFGQKGRLLYHLDSPRPITKIPPSTIDPKVLAMSLDNHFLKSLTKEIYTRRPIHIVLIDITLIVKILSWLIVQPYHLCKWYIGKEKKRPTKEKAKGLNG